jgi:hypothetical protein
MQNHLMMSGVLKIGSSDVNVPTVAKVTTKEGNFVVTRCKSSNTDVEVWAPTEIGAEGQSLSFRDLPVSFKRHNKTTEGKPVFPGYRAIQIHASSPTCFKCEG